MATESEIPKGKYLLINQETGRYLHQCGGPIRGERGAEGGWKICSGFESPPAVGTDDNYNNRAHWYIYLWPWGNEIYFIENAETKRYLLSDGDKISGERGAEGGWKIVSGYESPTVVGSDANYYNRACWKFIPCGDNLYFIENLETQRYLFQDGDKIRGKRGSEGGAQSAPSAVGADANYYNRAYWMLEKIPY